MSIGFNHVSRNTHCIAIKMKTAFCMSLQMKLFKYHSTRNSLFVKNRTLRCSWMNSNNFKT
jgi:hypothetical protein